MPDSLPPVLLVIEDNDADFAAFERSFLQASISCRLYRATGAEALGFLRRQSAGLRPAPRPSLILLSLELTGLDGKDLLIQLKQQDNLRSIPVIVFSSRCRPQEVEWLYHLGVNSYIPKPVNPTEFTATVQLLGEYWFTASLLPPSESEFR